MRKLILLIAFLLIPAQVFAGELYDYNNNYLRANYRRARLSTNAARLTNVFSNRQQRNYVYTLENNYHEASYIKTKRLLVSERERRALERLRHIQREQQEKEKELRLLERRLIFQLRNQRKLQDLRSQAYADLPESEAISVGSKSKEIKSSPKTGGSAANWVRTVLFDWNN